MKIFLIILLVLLVLILIVGAVYLIIGYVTFNFALSRKGKLKKEIELKSKSSLSKQPEIENYFSNFEKLEVKSNEDLKLVGFYKNNNKDKLALLVHGYGGSHYDSYSYSKIFEERGYDILAIDLRAHGESEGDYLTMGLNEHYDILKWIERLLKLNRNYKIVLFGISMGASTVCMTIGETLPNNVICAIEDCGYDNANNQLKYVYSKTKFVKLFYKIFYNYTLKSKGIDLKKIDAVEKLKSSKIPVLFIHGDKDDFVPTAMVYKLYEAVSQSRRDIYIAKDASHTKSIDVNEKEYKRRIDKFLTKYCV